MHQPAHDYTATWPEEFLQLEHRQRGTIICLTGRCWPFAACHHLLNLVWLKDKLEAATEAGGILDMKLGDLGGSKISLLIFSPSSFLDGKMRIIISTFSCCCEN